MCCYWRLPSIFGEQSDDGERSTGECLFATICCPCYWVCCLTIYCCCGLHDINDTIKRELPEKSYELREFELRQKQAPPKLPEKRKRALTLPLPSTRTRALGDWQSKEKKQVTFDQINSPLFRLPLELRQKIWTEVVGGKVLHINNGVRRLQHTLCHVCSTTDYCTGPEITCWPSYGKSAQRLYSSSSAPQKGGISALAKTCRRIYSETIHLAYSSNVFSFNDLYTLSTFFCSTLPLRLNAITAIRIYWDLDYPLHRQPSIKPKYQELWIQICRSLADMKGLKELRIKFNGKIGPGEEWREEGYKKMYGLMGLAGVKGVDREKFQVYVPWSVGRERGDEGELSYRLLGLSEWPRE